MHIAVREPHFFEPLQMLTLLSLHKLWLFPSLPTSQHTERHDPKLLLLLSAECTYTEHKTDSTLKKIVFKIQALKGSFQPFLYTNAVLQKSLMPQCVTNS